MHWQVAAPFFTMSNVDKAQWLDDFVPVGRHSFTKIPRPDNLAHSSWHNRISRNTSLLEWFEFWEQTKEAWQRKNEGFITVFPQLATTVGLRKRLFSKDIPVIAWCFNMGSLYSGAKQLVANFALQDIDRFIVHSRKECETVSAWLKLPQSKFRFIPLQRAPISVVKSEDIDNPFILSMGSANRDYQTFFDAVEKLGLRTIVVAGQHSIKGLTVPSNVEIRSGLSPEQCHHLAQRARVNVVPLIDHATGAGQVTIVEAMRMSRPLIATRCVGSEDYINHGTTGLFVRPYSVNDLVTTIGQLWSDETLRASLARNAGQYAEENFSDEAAGIKLGKILDEF